MHTTHREIPPLGLGLASVVLGAIGLMLFVLPILAIPISACGLLAGICEIALAGFLKTIDSRLALAGAVVCALGISVELAIAYAPSGDWGQPADPSTPSPAMPRPYVAPPARFRGCIERVRWPSVPGGLRLPLADAANNIP
ncbi:MAG TPA: hypothetical protein VGI40_23225 [Pirellulaceae bacterium]|jgi:hypothetical protein